MKYILPLAFLLTPILSSPTIRVFERQAPPPAEFKPEDKQNDPVKYRVGPKKINFGLLYPWELVEALRWGPGPNDPKGPCKDGVCTDVFVEKDSYFAHNCRDAPPNCTPQGYPKKVMKVKVENPKEMVMCNSTVMDSMIAAAAFYMKESNEKKRADWEKPGPTWHEKGETGWHFENYNTDSLTVQVFDVDKDEMGGLLGAITLSFANKEHEQAESLGDWCESDALKAMIAGGTFGSAFSPAFAVMTALFLTFSITC